MHFGGRIGFVAAIMNLRQNLRWSRSILQMLLCKIHESTEKTLVDEGSFYVT